MRFECSTLPCYYLVITLDLSTMTDRFIGVDGERLRKLRRKLALSQEDVERETGVAQATISDLEQGKRGARPSTLRKLAWTLKVEPRELMKGE